MSIKIYLGFHVLVGGVGDDREADQEDVSLRVAERAEALDVRIDTTYIVIFLSSCIPKTQADRFIVDHYVGTVVILWGELGSLTKTVGTYS